MAVRKLGVLGLLGLVAGCATVTKETRHPDVSVPAGQSATVDVSAVFRQSFASNSVYTEPREPGLMKRVLLSPNVVFESSRSSLRDPKTVGPADNNPAAPILPDALGQGITISNSSTLMRYLSARGSVLVAPVASSLWDSHAFCTATGCPERTWIERMMAVYRSEPKNSELPSAMLAVRHLGVGWKTLPAILTRNAQGVLVLTARRFEGEPSECPDFNVDVPVVSVSAEVVSIKDGRILARIDEERVPRINAVMTRTIETQRFAPESDAAYTEYVNGEPNASSRYTYVKGYTTQNLTCANAAGAFRDVQQNVLQSVDVGTMVTDMLASSLDQLYR